MTNWKRATPGQPLRPSAGTWNALIEAARRQQSGPLARQASPAPLPPARAWLKNTGGSTIPTFGWLEITGCATPHTISGGLGDGAGADFENVPCLTGQLIAAPTGPALAGGYAVAQAEIAPGAVGPIILRGLTWARLYQDQAGTADGNFASPTGPQLATGYAERKTTGPGRIVWAAGDGGPGGTMDLAHIILEDPSQAGTAAERCHLVAGLDFLDGIGLGMQYPYFWTTAGNQADNQIFTGTGGTWAFPPRAYEAGTGGELTNTNGTAYTLHEPPDALTTTYTTTWLTLEQATQYEITADLTWYTDPLSESDAASYLGESMSHYHGYTDYDGGVPTNRFTQFANNITPPRKRDSHLVTCTTSLEATWSGLPAGSPKTYRLGRSTIPLWSGEGKYYAHHGATIRPRLPADPARPMSCRLNFALTKHFAAAYPASYKAYIGQITVHVRQATNP